MRNYTQNQFLPVKLSQEEIENPELVIADLFTFDDLPGLKQLLWTWYTSTITGTYLDKDYINKSERFEILTMFEKIERLFEALWIMQK